MPLDVWGELRDIFDPTGDNPHVQDNITVAAPCLYERLPASPARGLDYGCGTGWMTAELQRRGYSMDAQDPSPAMIERARTRIGAGLRFVLGNFEALPQAPSYDFLISMMSLQFEFHLPDFARASRAAVNSGGRLVFATHSADYIDFAADREGMNIRRRPEGHLIRLGAHHIPIYRRDPEVYNRALSDSGWSLQHHGTVAFPEEFHQRYPEAEESREAPPKFDVYAFSAE